MRAFNIFVLGLLCPGAAVASRCKPSAPLASSSVSSSVSSGVSSSVSAPPASSSSLVPSSSSSASPSSSSPSSSSASASPTCGVSILPNGDFSAGFDSWTHSDPNGVISLGTDGTAPYETYLIYTASVSDTATISNVFPTVANANYQFSYYFEDITNTGITGIHCFFDNTAATLWVQSVSAGTWKSGNAGQFTASSTSTTLTCTFNANANIVLYLTNFEVIPICASAPA